MSDNINANDFYLIYKVKKLLREKKSEKANRILKSNKKINDYIIMIDTLFKYNKSFIINLFRLIEKKSTNEYFQKYIQNNQKIITLLYYYYTNAEKFYKNLLNYENKRYIEYFINELDCRDILHYISCSELSYHWLNYIINNFEIDIDFIINYESAVFKAFKGFLIHKSENYKNKIDFLISKGANLELKVINGKTIKELFIIYEYFPPVWKQLESISPFKIPNNIHHDCAI